MSSSNCSKYELPNSVSPDLKNIFQNNSNTVNPLLPFGIHIKGGVNVCATKCGHSLNNCENIQIENVINYGKIIVMVPKNKNSELLLHYDARNETADQNGSGKYKLKYICFTAPSTIKIGDSDSDIQSYLIYTNDNGLYCIFCTLYRNLSPYDNLSNSLLSGLLNHKLPNIGGSISGTALGGNAKNIDINDFFPQQQQDYYEYVCTEKSSNDIKNNILVKVYAKKVNISSVAINNLKEKLFDKNSNCTFTNFNDSLESTYKVNPENLNIFHVPDLGISKICSAKETMDNKNEDISDEDVEEEIYEEEMSVIQKLRKSTLEEKKENYINFTDDLKVYKIDIKDGSTKKVFPDYSSKEPNALTDSISFKNLLILNKNYEEDEIKRAISEFPNYIYQNSYWRINYKLRLYKVIDGDESDDLDSNFEIKDADNINDAVKIIGESNNEQVFYAMKNFPNYPVNKYYVSYYYPERSSDTKYIIIIYLLLMVFILLFNYVFYRLIYFMTNKDYGDISIDDNEIINDENLKQLASWRLLINIIFIFQMMLTIFYSILKVAEIYNKNKYFNVLFILSCILTLGITLYYAYLRFQFNDEKVSYSESRSLLILLEKSDENEGNSLTSYATNVINLLSNSLFYRETVDNLDNVYEDLEKLHKELLLSNEINASIIDTLSVKAEETMEELKKHLTRNFNYNKNKRSRFKKDWQQISDLFGSIYTEIKSKAPGLKDHSNVGKAKKEALDLIQIIKKQIDSHNNSTNNNNNNSVNSSNNDSSNNDTSNNESVNSNNSMKGGSNITPFVSGLKKSDKSIKGNNLESNIVLNGKEYFPNTNILNYNNETTENIEKCDWYDNLLKTITSKNTFIYIVFLITYTFITTRLIRIIRTFDTTNQKIYTTNGQAANAFSYLIFYGLFTVFGFMKLKEFKDWYFVGEENINNSDTDNTNTAILIAYSFWFIIVIFAFNFSGENSGASISGYWAIVTILLICQIAVAIFKLGYKNTYQIIKTLCVIVASILIFILPAALFKTPFTYRFMLLFIPILIGLTYKYADLLGITETVNFEINQPITPPDFPADPNNNFKIETPALIHSMEGLEQLKKSLENLTNKGGNIKKKKENLKNHIKHLLDIEEIFKNKGINQYSKLAEELRSQLSDITD